MRGSRGGGFRQSQEPEDVTTVRTIAVIGLVGAIAAVLIVLYARARTAEPLLHDFYTGTTEMRWQERIK